MSTDESLRFHFEQGEELLEELNNGAGITPELLRDMTHEMNLVRRNPEGTLLVGTEGTKTVTIFLAPHSVVQCNGPVLVPTFDALRVASMVSREFIESRAHACDKADDQDAAQNEWNALLDGLFNKTLELAEGMDELNSKFMEHE